MKKRLKFLVPLFALALLAFGGYAKETKDKDTGMVKVESVQDIAVAQVTQLEHKEAYKLDDAEFKSAVITNSDFSGGFTWFYDFGLIGILLITVAAILKKMRIKFTQVFSYKQLAMSALFIGAITFMPAAGIASLAIAAPVDTDESEELKAIKVIGDQVKAFKKDLGDKANAEEFKALNDQLKALKDGLKDWSGDKIEASMKTINDGIAKIGKQVEEMAEDVAKAKDGKSARKAGQFVALKDIEDFVKATFDGTRKTQNSAAIKLDGNMVFKAAETFGIPTFFEGASGTETDAFTGRMIDPKLYQRRRKRNLIIDNFPVESITVPKLIFLEKKEVSGADASSEDTGGAEWIISGQTKPPRSFRVTTGSVEAKKVAIFGTVEDKLLRDVPSLENWINEDFRDEIAEKYNDGLLNNNPDTDPDAPLGLKQNAIQFTASDAFDGKIASPNYIDMIVAVAAYMATLKEKPSKVFVADDVFYAMMILKDSENRYQNNTLVYVNTLGQLFIGGVQVVPADDEDVPATHVLAVSDSVGFKIKNYGPLVFERGLNGTDFKEDKTSYRGYQEVLTYISEHRYNSVLYDAWDNIEAGITAGS